jgi:hypothetical protein
MADSEVLQSEVARTPLQEKSSQRGCRMVSRCFGHWETGFSSLSRPGLKASRLTLEQETGCPKRKERAVTLASGRVFRRHPPRKRHPTWAYVPTRRTRGPHADGFATLREAPDLGVRGIAVADAAVLGEVERLAAGPWVSAQISINPRGKWCRRICGLYPLMWCPDRDGRAQVPAHAGNSVDNASEEAI